MEKIEVVLDGKSYSIDKNSTIVEFIEAYFSANKYDYVLAVKDEKLCELGSIIDRACELKFISKTSVMGIETYKRSLTLIMVKAFADVLGSKPIIMLM